MTLPKGPAGITSLNGWGSKDSSQNKAGADISASMDKNPNDPGWGGGGNKNNNNHNPHTGPTAAEIAAAKAKAEAEKRAAELKAHKEWVTKTKKDRTKKSKQHDFITKYNKNLSDKSLFDKWGDHARFTETTKNLGNTKNYHQIGGLDFMTRFDVKPSTAKNLSKAYQHFTEMAKAKPDPLDDYTDVMTGAQNKANVEAALNAIGIDAYGKDNELTQEYETFTDAGTKKYLNKGGVARKKYYKGSNGILDLDETDGEEISLTAFNPNFDEIPQLTDEEQLQIDSEENEDGEKRIDLFSETDEGDPLNELLLAEDGVTTLFRAKNGGYAVQGGVKNYLGEQEMVSAPKHWQSAPDHPETELTYITKPEKDLLVKADLHGSLHGSVNKGPQGLTSLNGWGDADDGFGSNNNNDNQGSDQGHSRFDVGSGYYGEPTTTTTTSDDDGDNYKDPILDMVDKTKIPGTEEYMEEEKTDYVEIPERKSPLTGEIRPRQLVTLAKAKQFEKIDAHIDEITGFGTQFWITKQIANTIKNKVPFGFLLPTIYPKVDMHGNVIKDQVTGSDLGHFQGEEWDHLWENVKDKDEGGDGSTVVPVHEEIQEYEEMAWDPMSYLDKIRAGQAQRASLIEKGIIQDNETMTLNSGGLANLFRVKNY